MKTKAAIFSVFMVTLTLVFGFNAACEETRPSQAANVYEHLLEQYISRCDAKIEMKNSKMDNIRQTAAVALIKGAFAKTYKKELINGMIQDGISPKSYKVQVYLNDQFYSFVRDRLYASVTKKKSTL